jgi:hypothetical protein
MRRMRMGLGNGVEKMVIENDRLMIGLTIGMDVIMRDA